ncbi:phage portal protein [Polaromonas sp.]|uniref:phage portal protein n=1 Tax=Polaromonas sp. TaxID=1869339 RepID=UPI003566C8BF
MSLEPTSSNKSTLGDLLNPIDRVLAWLSPAAGLRRIQQRHGLDQLQARSYDAASSTRLRKFAFDRQGPNAIAQQSAMAIRIQSRHSHRNHDIARGITRTMVNNVIGANGIGIEPTPRRADGTIHDECAALISKLFDAWMKRPEVQRRFHFAKCQRMMGGLWMRDGEAFSQNITGFVPGLRHHTDVPFSIELIAADFIPLDYNEPAKGIIQGAERDAWGEIKAWHCYKSNPTELQTPMMGWSDIKRVDAGRILQLAFLDDPGQVRGISEFASIITRLADIKDYEESERIAAKVAASLTAFIKKDGGQEGYSDEGVEKDERGRPKPRDMKFSPGMIIDNLAVGEEIGLIDSNRPNPNLITFRQGQLRAAAAGIGASYSSISKSYDGTFSAQRQELVEQYVNYAVLTDEFTGQWLQPTYEAFISAARLAGILKLPRDVVPESLDDALFTAQAMPWIDPLKEAGAWVMLARAGFASEIEVLRKRGVNPRDFLEQSKQWRAKTKDAGLVFTSNAENGATVEAPNGSDAKPPGAVDAADPEEGASKT